MCGLAGFVTTTPSTGHLPILQAMTGEIAHRGPDDSGFYSDAWAYLGHRRLSIVDLAGGHQPMSNETASLQIIYNGEIFNHADLRPELERAGHRYATRSDTETILHAFEQYGPESLARFRGMFAFAIWDAGARRLFCARDRLGIKPFYYFWDGRLFAFASEIKALLRHPAMRAGLDESVLAEYLAFGYVSSERTLFAGIRKLMPGHWLLLDLAQERPELRIERYWDVPAVPPDGRSEGELVEECRQRLEETVRMRLMADVPLGVFLSGGVDSSLVAALVKGMVSTPLQTFSVGYAEAPYSELGYASRAARAIGTEHHEIRIGMEDFFRELPRLIRHEDEPITWPSSVSLYFVSRLAAEQVKVVLTGEGADELFGGYERYSWNLLNGRALAYYRWLPRPLRSWIRARVESSSLLSATARRRLRHTVLGRDDTQESLYLDNFFSAFSGGERSRLLPGHAGDVYASYMRWWNSFEGGSDLARMLYADQKTYLLELLMKQDQMSMACSIESRVPFLDHQFVEFAMRLPDRLKIRGRTQKYILKKVAEPLLPADIVHRRKMGFPTPLRSWLRDRRAAPLLEALRDRDGLMAAWLERSEVARLIERHQSGFEDATDRLWRLLNLEIWGDLFITGRSGIWNEGALRNETVATS